MTGDALDLAAFARAVAEMRAAQREYFSRPTRAALGRAKAAEARVDAMLTDLAPEAGQTTLFAPRGTR